MKAIDKKPRIYTMTFASVYPLYVQKVEKKGRLRTGVNEVITWLTGYSEEQISQIILSEVNFEDFFAQAPHFNENAILIKGTICGVRIEEIEDPLMRKIRYLDKLVDELARGKSMEKIFRKHP